MHTKNRNSCFTNFSCETIGTITLITIICCCIIDTLSIIFTGNKLAHHAFETREKRME